MNIHRTAVALSAAAAAVAFALPAPTAVAQPGSTQSWGGAFAFREHSANVRAQASTGSERIDTMVWRDGGRRCYQSECTSVPGGSYTCWSGGPTGNRWIAVYNKTRTRVGWIAQRCAMFERIE